MTDKEYFTEQTRRWNVTLFRNDAVEGGIKNTVIHEYHNVRSKWVSGDVVDHEGKLCFLDENGKEVVASGLPFVVSEVTPASESIEESKAATA